MNNVCAVENENKIKIYSWRPIQGITRDAPRLPRELIQTPKWGKDCCRRMMLFSNALLKRKPIQKLFSIPFSYWIFNKNFENLLKYSPNLYFSSKEAKSSRVFKNFGNTGNFSIFLWKLLQKFKILCRPDAPTPDPYAADLRKCSPLHRNPESAAT